MKWTALVNSEIEKKRNICFSDFLNENNIENSLSVFDLDKDNFKTQVQDLVKSQNLIRVSDFFGEKLLSYFDTQTPQVMILGSADTIVIEKNLVYLRSAQYHCLLDIFKKKKVRIDVNKPGLVVGLGPLARYAISSLIQIGLKKIHITSENELQSQQFLKSIRKFNFDIQLEFFSKEKLLLQKSDYSLMICSIAHNDKTNSLFEELYYFNYLNESSLVWDFVLDSKETRLISEAKKLNFKTLDGIQFCAESDFIWAKWVSKKSIDLESYAKYLKLRIFQ